MGINILKASGLAFGAAVLWSCVFASASFELLKVGDKAPAFTATGTDGKTHTLASLTKEGPVFLYFIKEGCPVNHRAAPFVTKIYGEYGTKANVIGVYNGDVEGAKRWQRRYGANYPILSDPRLSLIRSYGVPYSPFMISVEKNGKVGKVLEGLSAKELDMANKLVAQSVEKKAIAISFEGAPSGGG